MAETQNTEPIVRATSIPWEQWVASLDAKGARTLDHTSIAQLVLAQMPQIRSKHWWAQSVAIAYEQHVGLRVVGQSCDGTYALVMAPTRRTLQKPLLQRSMKLSNAGNNTWVNPRNWTEPQATGSQALHRPKNGVTGDSRWLMVQKSMSALAPRVQTKPFLPSNMLNSTPRTSENDGRHFGRRN